LEIAKRDGLNGWESCGKAEPGILDLADGIDGLQRFSSQSSDGEYDPTVDNSCLSGAYTINASPDSMQVL
jgi:hypothetical protein